MKQYPRRSELEGLAHINAIEIFYVNRAAALNARREARKNGDTNAATAAGWYYWTCHPLCLPEGDPIGPYTSHLAALRAWWDSVD